jgi:murein DD-endopeptidase MepM/ murein hydrolase activator NlpD
MRLRRAFPALAVALAATAALGPPAAAAPGESGGAVAAPPAQQGSGGDGGGATYGQPGPAPKPKPEPKPKRRRPARPTSADPGPHRFPIAGAFDWGGADARFGAKRKGHRHQGQDLAAASGAPVVAPYRGVVTTVQYQAKAAGHYVVVHGDDYDYVFMHLRKGSIVVREGQRVRTGQLLAEVGSTGGSSGPHLHFELWLGPWYAGGHAVDPLALLEAWSGTAPLSPA